MSHVLGGQTHDEREIAQHLLQGFRRRKTSSLCCPFLGYPYRCEEMLSSWKCTAKFEPKNRSATCSA